MPQTTDDETADETDLFAALEGTDLGENGVRYVFIELLQKASVARVRVNTGPCPENSPGIQQIEPGICTTRLAQDKSSLNFVKPVKG